MTRPIIRMTAPAVLAVGMALAPSAVAHDQLVSTNPADGAHLTTAPHDITLRFNTSPLTMGSEVVVTAPGGSSKPVKSTVSGTTVKAPFAAGGNGTYTVTWRVVSSDGHPISGSFHFTTSGSTSTPSTHEPTATRATNTPAPGASSATSGASTTSRQHDGTSPWPWVAGTVAIVALVVGLVARRRSQTPPGGVRR